jgi:hypothetical protein
MKVLSKSSQVLQSYTYKFLVMLGVSCFCSCYYDNEASLYPGACSTDNVTYQGYVKPFIDVNCTCHVKGSKNGNVSLDGYAASHTYIVSGVMMKTIKHDAGALAMPPAVPKTDDCTISKLETWIKAGALNN